jgi:hypothetical protein
MYSEETEILAISPQEALEGAIDQLAEKFGFELGVTDYFVSRSHRVTEFANRKNEIVWRVYIEFVNPDQEPYHGCSRGEFSQEEGT